ncbi:MAG: carbohydrate kinase family protein [Bacillota bacterium]
MSDRYFDAVVVGAIGIDTNVFLQGSDIDFEVEANFTENIDYIGQAGGFSCRGFCSLGKSTAFIGYVGDDFSGRYIREQLYADGIDTSALFTDPKGTRRSCNFMYKDGRRKNFYDGKGNMELIPDKSACNKIFSNTKLAHFSIENWARHLLPEAKRLGVTISCDLQDIVDENDSYRKDFIDYADVIFFSSVNFADPSIFMNKLLERNSSRIIISGMGAKGCALGTKESIRYFAPVELDDAVVDTNGAGDGLAVGFLTSYFLDGYSLEDSILRGQITARYTCTQRASTSNLIRMEQLNSLFKEFK